MKQDLIKIKTLLLRYIKLILNSYSNCDNKRIMNALENNSEIVKFNSSNTITFIVQDDVLLLPKAAYQVFPLLKQYDNLANDVSSVLEHKSNYKIIIIVIL